MIVRHLGILAFASLVSLVASAALMAAPAAPAGTSGKSDPPRKKVKSACKLLTNAEIESVLTAAPLDLEKPRKVKIPNVRRNFSNCSWDDELEPTEVGLAVYTGLIRKAKPAEIEEIGVAAPGTTARDLTAEELDDLGERGTVEIVRDGTYGTVAVVDGKRAFFVSAAYQGPGAVPPVTEAELLALARLAAARV